MWAKWMNELAVAATKAPRLFSRMLDMTISRKYRDEKGLSSPPVRLTVHVMSSRSTVICAYDCQTYLELIRIRAYQQTDRRYTATSRTAMSADSCAAAMTVKITARTGIRRSSHFRLSMVRTYLLASSPTSVKIGKYIEITMPPTMTPRTTIIAGSMAVMRSPTAASTSSS